MPKISYSKEAEYIERIRAIIVRRPQVTILQIKKILEDHPKAPMVLDKDYIHRLANKIRKDRAQRLNHYTVNVVLGKFEQEVEELKMQLWAIIGSTTVSDKVKVSAIKELRSSSAALFDKMFDAGLFKKNLGKLETEQSLSPEVEEMITKAISHGYGEPDTTDNEKPSTPESTS